jgi:hypothetical protein
MMAMFKNGGLAAMLLLGAGLSSAYAAEVTHSVDPDNGLQGWHFSSGDIEIELIQRLPDQTRAMFMKHAFSREVIEQLALSCIFQTIIRNTGKSGSGQAVSVDLAQWRLRHDGATGRWGMFPTQQDFLPGDYNWGMTAYGLPPGAVFDLEVNWKEADMQHSGEIGGVLCAPDVDKLK